MRVSINKENIKNIRVLELNTMWTLDVQTNDGASVEFTLEPAHVEYLLEAIATQKKVHSMMQELKALRA